MASDVFNLDARAVKTLIEKIGRLKSRIAKDRDALRDLIYEMEDICSGCDDAVDSLDNAADAMSRLV